MRAFHELQKLQSETIKGSTKQTARSYRISINTKVVGKTAPNQLSYAGAFTPKSLTLRELATHCGQKGQPWMPSVLDKGARRFQQHANFTELLTLDIDSGMTIEEAKLHPFISKYCGLAIETASSTPELNKFRLVFPLASAINDWRTIKACNIYLQHLIQVADKSCKDASRFYFGATGREPFVLNESACLPKSFVQDALEWNSAQERIAEEQNREALRRAEERRSQYGEPTEQERIELVEQAISHIPPRKLGSGNYQEWMRILAALVHEFGIETAIALVERYSPSVKGSTWNVPKKARSFQRGTSRPATLGSVFYIAKSYGFRFPESERKSFEVGKPDHAAYQTKVAVDEKRDPAEEAEDRERNIGIFRGFCNKVRQDNRRKVRDRAPEIVAEQSAKQRYVPGQLPDYCPGLKLPTYTLKAMSDRNLFVYEAYQKGWKHVLDRSGPGSGKSYYAGYLEPERFDLELDDEEIEKSDDLATRGKTQLRYMTNESRNPSTATIEANFKPLPVRHTGLEPTEKRTPLKNIVHKASTDPSQPHRGNCHRSHLFTLAGEKGLIDDSNADAARNPICLSCPFVGKCATEQGDGYGFKLQRKEAEANDRLSLNPQSASAKMSRNTVRIWEELSAQIKPEIRKSFNLAINSEWWMIEREQPEIYEVLKPIRRLIADEMAHPSNRWGVTAETIRQKIRDRGMEISDIEKVTILQELEPILKPSLGELMEIASGDNSELRVKVEKAERLIESLMRRMEKCNFKIAELDRELPKPIPKLDELFFQDVRKKKGLQKIREYWSLIDHRNEAESEARKAVDEYNTLQAEYEAAKTKSKVSRGENQQAAINRLKDAPTQVLWHILKMLFFPEWGDGNFRISSNGIILTLPSGRIPNLAKSAKANLYLDATAHPEIFKAQLGISDLLICELEQPRGNNLTHYQILGYGKCGRNRAESTNDKLKFLHEGICEREAQMRGVPVEAVKIAIADYKSVEAFDAKIRHLSNSRGSNEIEGIQVMIAQGVPKPNQGAIEDEYACISNPDFTFEQYYQYKVDSEIKQLAGRQRNERYPDQQFSIYWVNDDTMPFATEQIEAIDISYQAAPKSQRIAKSVFGAICEAAKLGVKLTQKLIAQFAEVTQGFISQWFRERGGWRYWRDLIVGKPVEDIEKYRSQLEPIEATIAEVLPLEIEEATESEQVLAVVSEFFADFGADAFKRIWQAISWKYRRRFIAALLAVGVPKEVWHEPAFGG